MDIAVDFASDAQSLRWRRAVEIKISDIYTRLNGEHNSGNKFPAILGFQVVDVDTDIVSRGTKTVSCSMEKRISVSRFSDDLSTGIVYFVTVDILPGVETFLHKLHRTVTSSPDYFEYRYHLFRDLLTTVRSPGNVGEARLGIARLAVPEIYEYYVASTYLAAVYRARK